VDFGDLTDESSEKSETDETIRSVSLLKDSNPDQNSLESQGTGTSPEEHPVDKDAGSGETSREDMDSESK